LVPKTGLPPQNPSKINAGFVILVRGRFFVPNVVNNNGEAEALFIVFDVEGESSVVGRINNFASFHAGSKFFRGSLRATLHRTAAGILLHARTEVDKRVDAETREANNKKG
jgi:hypothetical protein